MLAVTVSFAYNANPDLTTRWFQLIEVHPPITIYYTFVPIELNNLKQPNCLI